VGLPFNKEPDQHMVHYTVEAILEGLKASDNNVLVYIYRKYFPIVRFFVIKNSGTDEDAKDIFQEAIILIYKRLTEGSLDLSCAFKTYIYSVARFLWLQQLEKRHVKTDGWTDSQVFIEMDKELEERAIEQERFKLFQKHFQSLNKDCQEILKLFLKKVPLKEIAQRVNIKSDKYLKKRKYECKEMLTKRIQNDPDFKRYKDDW